MSYRELNDAIFDAAELTYEENSCDGEFWGSPVTQTWVERSYASEVVVECDSDEWLEREYLGENPYRLPLEDDLLACVIEAERIGRDRVRVRCSIVDVR